MNSDGLSQLSSLIYNDFKNVNNTISEAYDKANSAYDSVSAAYDKANSAYDSVSEAYNKANNAYNQANSAYSYARSVYSTAITARYNADDAYNQANNAYNQANSAYDKANSAYDLAINGGSGGSDDSYIYYNTQSVFFLSYESMLGFPVYCIQANIPLSYFEYKPHSVSFTFKSNSIYNTTYTSQGVTGFVFEPIHQYQVEDGYGTASSSYIPLYVNTNDYSFRIENASFKFTK